jgi:5-formyltetrahydrofolate cyclo-ligase
MTLVSSEEARVQDISPKQNVRLAVLRAREAMSVRERADAGRFIRDAVLGRPEVEMAASVAAYVSFGTEPDTRSLLFALWKRGTYVLLPLLLPGGDLDWASYEGPDSLTAGRFGLLEPTEPRRGVDAIKAADVVLAPALAVSPSGLRLGRGGGSYDRALARVGPNILTVGLVYDAELLDSVPAEPHDQRLRAVVTPSGGFQECHS